MVFSDQPVNEWLKGWISGWEWRNNWMNQSQWMSLWMIEESINERMRLSACVNERECQRMNEWMSQTMNERKCQWKTWNIYKPSILWYWTLLSCIYMKCWCSLLRHLIIRTKSFLSNRSSQTRQVVFILSFWCSVSACGERHIISYLSVCLCGFPVN